MARRGFEGLGNVQRLRKNPEADHAGNEWAVSFVKSARTKDADGYDAATFTLPLSGWAVG